MIAFNTISDLARLAEEKSVPMHDIVLAKEQHDAQRPRATLLADMARNWEVMKASVRRGIENEAHSASGLTGGDAEKLYAHRTEGYLGEIALRTAAYAVGVSEVNATMGRIVACPTAGSCGIMPAVLCAAQEQRGYADDAIVLALFTAAGIGMVIDQNASIAGAEGGCQAECGTAAGMAAAALVELAGGTPQDIANACALAIKNLLGLACDPVAGLVEVPCVKRNGFCAVHAALAADMTLAGIRSVIPCDDVIAAMDAIGRSMPAAIRETAEGGLAATERGRALAAQIYPKHS